MQDCIRKEMNTERLLALQGPRRVWDGEYGMHPREAQDKGVKIDCCFVREDGWTLGCPREHIRTAENQWPDEWAMVYIMRNGEPEIRFRYDEWTQYLASGLLKFP